VTDGPAQLDVGTIEGLRDLGGDEFLEELIGTFLDEAPTLLAGLRSPDEDEVRRAAHTLKSNAATFGAAGLTELCRELEESARSGELSGGEDVVAQIDAEFERVQEALVEVRRSELS
jgi:HPt (histidine-containing phosphotransfer) domain-containing protein